MTSSHIDQAFILAAGKGKRMRPLTDDRPKPMVLYKDRPIIDHILDKLVAHGVKRVVINLHYLGEVIESHLKSRDDIEIVYSHEDTLLDTGGGLKKGLAHLEERPFFVLSGDGPWEDKENAQTALQHLENNWDVDSMDILMLLQPVSTMSLTQGIGDYNFTENGHVQRSHKQTGTHMFTSLRIVSPPIFENTSKEETAFSFLDLMDRAEAAQKLYGLEHQGVWHHLSTPTDVKHVNDILGTR